MFADICTTDVIRTDFEWKRDRRRLGGSAVLEGLEKKVEDLHEEELHLAELLPKNISKNSKHATKQMITTFWRMPARIHTH